MWGEPPWESDLCPSCYFERPVWREGELLHHTPSAGHAGQSLTEEESATCGAAPSGSLRSSTRSPFTALTMLPCLP